MKVARGKTGYLSVPYASLKQVILQHSSFTELMNTLMKLSRKERHRLMRKQGKS